MASNQLSQSEIQKIPGVLQKKGWTQKNSALELSKAVTRKLLKPYLTQEGLSRKKIRELIKNKLLPDCLSTIEDDYPDFLRLEMLTVQQVRDLIESQMLYKKGYHEDTCDRFLKGVSIRSTTFQPLYEEFFDTPFYAARSRSNNSGQRYNLKDTLVFFNHFNEKKSFRKFKTTNKSFAFLHLSSLYFHNPCGLKLLLKILLSESKSENNLVICFKSSAVLTRNFSEELRKILVERLNKQKLYKLSSKIRIDSDWQDIARAIAWFLRKNHLIFIFEDRGKEINTKIITCLQSLIGLIKYFQNDPLYLTDYSGENYLFSCFFFEHKDTAEHCLNIKPPHVFTEIERHLSTWLNNRTDVSDLFNISTESEIQTKVIEIKDKATEINSEILSKKPFLQNAFLPDSLLPEALLKAIYAKCNCEWDEEYWTTWQSPTL
ncbi:MAG TPA: hypothetical protein DCM02_02955 [Flavobacterium sp.]|nr:hypothetical protein [Flavobacterium sp.]